MKTRKLLPLIILAVVAVLALSSCDAILDAIFQSNQISVEVAVNTTIGRHTDFFTGGYVNLQLTGPGVSSSVSAYYGSWDGLYAYYYFTFPKLPDGGYNLFATYFGSISTSAPIYNITMPFKSPSNPDSTGQSVTIYLTIP